MARKNRTREHRKRPIWFYMLGTVLILATVVALGAWRPAVDLWAMATMDRAQLWGNIWVDTETWATQDERRERPGTLSDVRIDGFPASLSPRDSKLTQCWRGNGEVIASVETVSPTGGLPTGRLQLTITPDEWASGLPAAKQAQQRDPSRVPSQATGHVALNFTSTDGSVRYYGQAAHDHNSGDVVIYKDNRWVIRAGLFSPTNSTAALSKIEATVSCPDGR
jgi:hypothetical protein